jgi:hypothetical protein
MLTQLAQTGMGGSVQELLLLLLLLVVALGWLPLF